MAEFDKNAGVLSLEVSRAEKDFVYRMMKNGRCGWIGGCTWLHVTPSPPDRTHLVSVDVAGFEEGFPDSRVHRLIDSILNATYMRNVSKSDRQAKLKPARDHIRDPLR